MSVKVMSYVWDNSAAEGTALLMLLAIADHANDDGQCWPSISRLAQKARIGERQAKRLIAELEALGEITIERGIGRKHTSIYTITGITPQEQRPQRVSRKTPLRGADNAGKGDIHDIKGDIQREKVTSSAGKGDIAMSPEPSVEPSIEPSRTVRGPVKPPPTLAKHKAIIVYENLVRFPPDNISEQAIVSTVGTDEPSLKKWGDTISQWLMSGYRGSNVRGMLDWYIGGIPTYTNGHNGNGNGKPKMSEIPNTHRWDNYAGSGKPLTPEEIESITF